MRVRRPQHGRVQTTRHAQIIDELPCPRDEPRILPPPHGPRMLRHGWLVYPSVSAGSRDRQSSDRVMNGRRARITSTAPTASSVTEMGRVTKMA